MIGPSLRHKQPSRVRSDVDGGYPHLLGHRAGQETVRPSGLRQGHRPNGVRWIRQFLGKVCVQALDPVRPSTGLSSFDDLMTVAACRVPIDGPLQPLVGSLVALETFRENPHVALRFEVARAPDQ